MSSSNARKGQSAIEYLMTYGWMLLVVAIVGGAIFATVNNQRSSCSGDIPRAMMPGQNDGFGVDQFAVTSSSAQVVLSNQGAEDVTVTNVSLSGDSISDFNATSTSIPTTSETTLTLDGVVSGDSCADADMEITYNVGEITGQTVSGEISAEMQNN